MIGAVALKVLYLRGSDLQESFINPLKLLGEVVIVHLKDGGIFGFKITGCGEMKNKGYIEGFDDEHLNLTIYADDIDYLEVR